MVYYNSSVLIGLQAMVSELIYNESTTLKQGTANENAANVGSSKGSDQRENDKWQTILQGWSYYIKSKLCETPTRLEPI